MFELELIEKIKKTQILHDTDCLQLGIGDDCAVVNIPQPEKLVTSTDILVQDVHFDLRWHPFKQLGMKAAAVNLSDIAAMGGKPKYLLQSFSIPDYVNDVHIDNLIQGVSEMSLRYGCQIIGGDTSKGSSLVISITVIGFMDGVPPVLRSNAQPGDSIYVSGYTGLAAAGLNIYKAEFDNGKQWTESYAELRKEHLQPEPQIKLGRALAKSGLVNSMQDISDGLATDLAHICTASGVGAEIFANAITPHPELKKYCVQTGESIESLAIQGGDDYHLVFTVKKGKEDRLLSFLESRDLPTSNTIRVGAIIPGKGVGLIDKDGCKSDITYQGFEHT